MGSRSRQRGFNFLWAIAAVAIMAIYLGRIGTIWTTEVRRENEHDLLVVGNAIRQAIKAYVDVDKDKRFPTRLHDLLSDPRVPYVRRFLRQAYVDPMTSGDWELIRGPHGELFGVYSRADGVPLKQDGFDDEYANFAHQQSYADWKFAHYPGGGGNVQR
ncbi:Type II secretory pathway, pseudopilin PulG [Dyella jiangningensis]|uniref:hypothetical protein n=1 Tax=Dyella sp. AtDHG13 TaxID=1938897 RepID=UPI0008888368|nr:hypothetical protein [Dyella sp. AtDHG13]PXV57048.1 type II secretory pathway pseudopilin PulG [Dyella sp. AtDHG13]SDK65261.1 Type II secretory pathway, pseudopilin PulG [Dyella jiangningensis]